MSSSWNVVHFCLLALLQFATHRMASGQGNCSEPKADLLAGVQEDSQYQVDKAACFQKISSTERRIRIEPCSEQEPCGGYAYQIDEAHIGNAIFDRRDSLTALFRDHRVQICSFGRMDTRALLSSPLKLQYSIHGQIKHALSFILNPAIPFCDIHTDACNETAPSCGELGANSTSGHIKNFCACSTVDVPNVPGGFKIEVDVTMKILDTAGSDVDECETEFDSSSLLARRSNPKKTLACFKIPSKVVTKNQKKAQRAER